MKVLIVYHYVAHYRVPIFNQLIANNTEHEYHLAASNKANQENINIVAMEDICQGSARVHKIENIWISKNILWQKNLLKLVIKEDFDVVVLLGNMYFISNWLVMILAKIKGFKTLQWTHGLLKPDNNFLKYIRSSYYRLSDGLMLYGERAISLLEDIGIKKNSMTVIYNSLDYEKQKKIINKGVDVAESPWQKNYDIRCIFTGRLRSDRRLDLLVDAISFLKKHSFEVGLLIVGGGPLEEELKRMASEKKCLDNIIFYGNCYEEETLYSLFKHSDLCVVPGIVGLNCIHAMTYGVPVLTSDLFESHGPEFEAIDPKQGVGGFYRYGDARDLASKIKDFSSSEVDLVGIKSSCKLIIEANYNPVMQAKRIDEAVNNVFNP